MDDEEPLATLTDTAPGGFSTLFAVFFFAFGTAAGFLLAFTGLGFLEESAGVIAGVFLSFLFVIALAGMVLTLFRRRILRALFGMADLQIEHLAEPLADVAQELAQRQPEAAALSARRLIRRLMARYAWLSTRRWIMTSLTALIAALAALAGTALLFKQNALLGEQIVLLAEQNQRIDWQNTLLEQQTELAEAARAAGLTVEVTTVAGLLGEAAQAVALDDGRVDAQALPASLTFRVIALSQGLRPYRFLDTGVDAGDQDAQGRLAMLGRRAALPGAWERMAAANGWSSETPRVTLIDRPASPERGQLLRAMLVNGIRDFALFAQSGLDLGFAYAPGLTARGVSLAGLEMTLADLSNARLEQLDFSRARLANTRFRRAVLQAVRFDDGDDGGATLTGGDFKGAALIDCALSNSFALGAIFDNALLMGVDFSGAVLVAASFRDAVLIAPDWSGAHLGLADFDGAYVFGADPLAEMAAAASSLDPALYRAEPVSVDVVIAASDWDYYDADSIAARTGGAPAWRLERIAAFP